MDSYLITYDLCKPGQNYEKLYEAIKKHGKWCHCLESIWIVKSQNSAAAIRDALLSYIDNNDKILVVKLNGEGAWKGITDECSKWLKENL